MTCHEGTYYLLMLIDNEKLLQKYSANVSVLKVF